MECLENGQKEQKKCIIEILKGTERRNKHLGRVLVAAGGATTPSDRRRGAYEQGTKPPNARRALQFAGVLFMGGAAFAHLQLGHHQHPSHDFERDEEKKD